LSTSETKGSPLSSAKKSVRISVNEPSDDDTDSDFKSDQCNFEVEEIEEQKAVLINLLS